MMRSLACLLAAAATAASAQTFPSKPLHVVVPYAAGGAVATIARAFAPHLSAGFGQPVIVDDKPGAGANIGADAVAKAPPDGATVLLSPAGLAISPAMYRKLPFDAAKDFAAVSQLMSSWLILVTAQKVRAKSVQELLALAKANPG